MSYDVLPIGGGIAGMESALTFADMDFLILLVEKEPSIGGKLILLSRAFPTLDCSSCISTWQDGPSTSPSPRPCRKKP